MESWIQKNGCEDKKALTDYAAALADYYGEAIGSLSCEMYEKTASAQGATIPPAQPAETPTYGEVAKATLGSLKQSEKMVPLVIGRLVKTVGADTTLKNAERDNAEAAWISYGENCDYCLNLASKGWQHVTKSTLKNGHAEHIHANCKCQYSVRFNKESSVEGYEPEELLEARKNTTSKGYTSKIDNATIVEKLREAGGFKKTAKIHLVPTSINTEALTFDDTHINQERAHNITEKQAKQYIRDAKISVSVWNGQFERYYGVKGATYVDMRKNEIRTAYSLEEYDEKTISLIEEMSKNGLLR